MLLANTFYMVANDHSVGDCPPGCAAPAVPILFRPLLESYLAKGRCPAAKPPFITTQSYWFSTRVLGISPPKGVSTKCLYTPSKTYENVHMWRCASVYKCTCVHQHRPTFLLSNVQHSPAEVKTTNICEPSPNQSLSHQPSTTGNIQYWDLNSNRLETSGTVPHYTVLSPWPPSSTTSGCPLAH